MSVKSVKIIAPSGNRTPGKCLEGAYVTTTPMVPCACSCTTYCVAPYLIFSQPTLLFLLLINPSISLILSSYHYIHHTVQPNLKLITLQHLYIFIFIIFFSQQPTATINNPSPFFISNLLIIIIILLPLCPPASSILALCFTNISPTNMSLRDDMIGPGEVLVNVGTFTTVSFNPFVLHQSLPVVVDCIILLLLFSAMRKKNMLQIVHSSSEYECVVCG